MLVLRAALNAQHLYLLKQIRLRASQDDLTEPVSTIGTKLLNEQRNTAASCVAQDKKILALRGME